VAPPPGLMQQRQASGQVRCPCSRSEATHHAGTAPLHDVASALL